MNKDEILFKKNVENESRRIDLLHHFYQDEINKILDIFKELIDNGNKRFIIKTNFETRKTFIDYSTDVFKNNATDLFQFDINKKDSIEIPFFDYTLFISYGWNEQVFLNTIDNFFKTLFNNVEMKVCTKLTYNEEVDNDNYYFEEYFNGLLFILDL